MNDYFYEISKIVAGENTDLGISWAVNKKALLKF